MKELKNTVHKEENREIGFFGSLHRNYLQDYHKERYKELAVSGQLWTYLADLNEQCEERRESMTEQLMLSEGVTEELKKTDQREWLRRLDIIQSRVYDAILNEMVYV